MTQRKPKIGLIGAGSIGRAVASWILDSGLAELDYILVSDAKKPRDFNTGKAVLLDDMQAALARDVDLVVEAAMAQNVKDMAPLVLKSADFMAFSCTAMADRDTETAVLAAAAASGHTFYIPHGAVLGLDGIADGRDLIESVTITTHKSGKSLGLAEDATGVIFDGSTREIAAAFPRNVNVHSAIAMAGIGFDRTVSRLVAVPGQKENIHRIEVKGEGFDWVIDASSVSLGGVTGAFTPLSAIGSVRRVLERKGLKIV